MIVCSPIVRYMTSREPRERGRNDGLTYRVYCLVTVP
jgi:hypothetical protein